MNLNNSIGSNIVTRIKVQNVMSALLPFAIPLLVVGAVLSILSPTRVFGECLVGLDVSVFFGAYIYFAIREPNRLQSEDYLNEQRRLDLQITDAKTYPTREALEESYSAVNDSTQNHGNNMNALESGE